MTCQRIVLIEPPARWLDNRYSLGLMYISSYLSENGYPDNIILDRACLKRKSFSLEYAADCIIENIIISKPIFVGFSTTVTEVRQCIEIAGRIKRLLPDTLTCAGGPQATVKPDDFLENGFDFVVRGEGEYIIKKLMQEIERDKDYKSIPGLSWKDNGSEKRIVHNPDSSLIKDINVLSYPAFDKVCMKHYSQLHPWIIRGMPLRCVLVMSSRGCPYSCSYCACNSIMGKKVRYRAPENIFGEIKLLRDKYNIEAVWFADDMLTVNRKHVLSVCNIMKELGVYWGCQARVDSIDEELVREMKASGCIQLDFGVESGSDRVLKEIINKKASVDQTKNVFRLCDKVHMRTLANLMIGLPTETLSEMNDTLRLAREIKADTYVLSIATPLPGTKLWEMVGAEDIISYKDYENLNFVGDLKLIDKYNKSEVKEIIKLRSEFINELEKISFKKKLRTIFFRIILILKLRDPVGRFWYEISNSRYASSLKGFFDNCVWIK